MKLVNKVITNFFKINIIIDCVLIVLMIVAAVFIPFDFIKSPKDITLVNHDFVINVIVFLIQILLLFAYSVYHIFKKDYKKIWLSLLYIIILIILIFINYILEALSLVKGL